MTSCISPRWMNEWGARLLLFELAPAKVGGLLSLLGVTKADRGPGIASTSSYSTKPIRAPKPIGDKSRYDISKLIKPGKTAPPPSLRASTKQQPAPHGAKKRPKNWRIIMLLKSGKLIAAYHWKTSEGPRCGPSNWKNRIEEKMDWLDRSTSNQKKEVDHSNEQSTSE